ncbi:MAG: reverse transcriptase family protein, partial [Aeromonas sp.]
MQLIDSYRACTHRLVLCGDFNFPGIDWTKQIAGQGSQEEKFLEWMQMAGLYQKVSVPTRYRGVQVPSILDLVITSIERDAPVIDLLPPLGCSDHAVLKFTLSVLFEKIPPKLIRNFTGISGEKLLEYASEMDWFPHSDSNVEDRWDILKSNILELQEVFAPLRRRRTGNKPLWWKAKVKRQIRLRDKLWERYRCTRTVWDWVSYKQQRNATVQLQRKLKGKFELSLAQSAKRDPKRFYTYAQTKRALRNSVGNLLTVSGEEVASDYGKAQLLKSFFESVHRVDSGIAVPHLNVSSGSVISDINFDDINFRELLSGIRKGKSPGPDGIYPEMIRLLADLLEEPVRALFQQSFASGQIPNDWKTATVVAIHKSGSTGNVANYRPVSLTCVLCKIFERIIRDHVCKYAVGQSFLGENQHGFRKGRSCLTNLLKFLDLATQRLDEGKPIEVCYLDFSKAFDSVNLRFLCAKLDSLGISGGTLRWVTTFLEGRT